MFSQQQNQKQQIKILPYQIELLNFYFLNRLELEQRIKTELVENPFLEEAAGEDDAENKPVKDAIQDYYDNDEFMYDDIPDHKAEYQNYFNSETAPDIPMKSFVHYKDEAKGQLQLLDISEDELEKTTFIIDLLNDNGILDKDLEEVADIMSFYFKSDITTEQVGYFLGIVKTLEPIGIGSCSIQECLLMQLGTMNGKQPFVKKSLKLLRDHYNDLIHRQFEKIQKALKIDDEELKILVKFISTLKFYPVSEDATQYETKNTLLPDLFITRQDDEIFVNIYSCKSSQVFVNSSLYDELSQQISKRDRSAKQYVKNKLHSAQWFINAIKQREETMLCIMRCIVDRQKEYFMDGDTHLLKPMILKNIADEIGMDISTISRITSNKFADTHFGTIRLKDLFSEGVADKQGNIVSNKVIQSVMEELILTENKEHSYSDGELADILAERGFNIARRTVAKYREKMNIPIAQIRTLWA